jgi:hypothetical protein
MSDHIFDDIARTLATPVPRRKALKVIAGGFAAAALAFFGGKAALANGTPTCKTTEKPCGTDCCNSAQVCVNNTKCCSPRMVCGNSCCNTGEKCGTDDNGQKVCKPLTPSSAA